MSGSWSAGWVTGDLVSAAELKKGVGCIYDSTLGDAAAWVDITLPSVSYAHLGVVYDARCDGASTPYAMTMRFNADAGSDYSWQNLLGVGAASSASPDTGTAGAVGVIPGATGAAGQFAKGEILIPDYATGTTAIRGWTSFGGFPAYISLTAGAWSSASAINQLTFFPAAGNFVVGSRFTVYAMGS